MAIGLALGLLVGLAIASVGQSPETPSPQEQAVQPEAYGPSHGAKGWEYKVVRCASDSKYHTKLLNALAADGWAFAFVVVEHPNAPHPAFRRPKE